MAAAQIAAAQLGPELYNLDVDPSERYNVASAHPEIVERLRTRMEEFRGQLAQHYLRSSAVQLATTVTGGVGSTPAGRLTRKR